MRVAGLLMGMALAVPAFAQSPVPSDEDIRAILEQRVEVELQGVGLVVGVVEPEGTRVVSYGTVSVDDPTPVDGDTLFEIGSVAKVFTTLLLAEAVERGEVRLDQPVADLLPEGVDVPERDGRAITLLDLAIQRSGLPRLPDNFDPADVYDPYADYRAEDLYAFLASHALPRGVDEAYEYSNLGMGLLGHALAEAAGADYETLLRERVLAPLGMDDTVIVIPDALQDRRAQGHDAALEPVPDWTWDVLEGAGALRSTANDMLKFLAAAMGDEDTPLAPAFALSSAPRAETDPGLGQIGLGWNLTPLGDDELVWHNGGTGGFRSFVGYLRAAGVGVAVLSNTATDVGVDDLGPHLLDPSLPLAPVRMAVEVDPYIFEGLTGVYELAPGFTITVFTQGDRLLAQATGQDAAEIFPESETEFFYRIVDAQITFEVDAEGRASALTLHQFGQDMPMQRVD